MNKEQTTIYPSWRIRISVSAARPDTADTIRIQIQWTRRGCWGLVRAVRGRVGRRARRRGGVSTAYALIEVC